MARCLVTWVLQLAVAEVMRPNCGEEMMIQLVKLRKARNSREALNGDFTKLYAATTKLEQTMRQFYGFNDTNLQVDWQCDPLPRPGNLHEIKSHAYYVGAIRKLHSFPAQAVQSIVASEWYHPGLTAKSVWCVDSCELPLAQRLNRHFPALQKELEHFWLMEAKEHLKGVGSHTTSFDQLIAGNGTWQDVRLWRGRAFDRRLCERFFRVTCSLIEASPEVWTNPWSHVLISVLMPNSWVPFHQGHTNGQLTYHLPVMLPEKEGSAELAVLDAADETEIRSLVHPDEFKVAWKLGKTLVFDFIPHAVRYRGLEGMQQMLLMRAWHPEQEMQERSALREFIHCGCEEEPEGYETLPVPPGSQLTWEQNSCWISRVYSFLASRSSKNH